MGEIERIFEQLDCVTDDNFYQIEANLFMAFQRIPNEKKPSSVIACQSVASKIYRINCLFEFQICI